MSPQPCLIFTAGEWCSMEVVQDHLAQGPNVLTCDGALATCLESGIVPDAVIGDMDSVGGDVLERFVSLGGEVLERKEQDSHDLTKALALAEDRGHSSCIVIGATGGDREHEWANLLSCAATRLDIQCVGEEHVYHFLLTGKHHSIEIEAGQKFSLFTVPTAGGITLSGAKYGLENETLSMGSRGLHNVATSSTLQVYYTQGRLMLLMRRPSSKAEETT